ncbi:MAG: hypothetical protein NC299_10570 [Lachnospiraceae bacterium]|nr:hypothetical protein [Ruminococcus sp.]MCM1275791.1 hypothetical protein [Lachnospiraceae bacterium]
MEQIKRFIWNTAKSKLEIKLPLKCADDPLLLCVEFNSDNERYYFGEAKAVRQVIEDSNRLSKHGGSILTLSEQRPLGGLLMDSYDFVQNGCLRSRAFSSQCSIQLTAAIAKSPPITKCLRSCGKWAMPFSG